MNIFIRRRLTLPGFSDWFLDGEPFCVGVENHDLRVPAGMYELHPHQSSKSCLSCTGGQTVALHNPELGVYAEVGMAPSGRFDCLIHPANWGSQLEGCLAPGEHIDIVPPNGLGVTQSEHAFCRLAAALGGWTGHTLTITETV